MRDRMTLPWGAALLAGALLAVAVPAQPQTQNPPPQQGQSAQSPDSAADAARKAKAEKSKAKPKKVYTDEDMSSLSGGGISVVGDKDSSAAAPDGKNPDAKPAGGDAAKSGKNGEAYWRGKAGKIRDQMAAIDQQIEKLQEEIKKQGNGGFDPASGLSQNVIYVTDRSAQVKQLEKKKADLQKQMDELAEEGRKAGADPGWFR
jgi:hypothetical protein